MNARTESINPDARTRWPWRVVAVLSAGLVAGLVAAGLVATGIVSGPGSSSAFEPLGPDSKPLAPRSAAIPSAEAPGAVTYDEFAEQFSSDVERDFVLMLLEEEGVGKGSEFLDIGVYSGSRFVSIYVPPGSDSKVGRAPSGAPESHCILWMRPAEAVSVSCVSADKIRYEGTVGVYGYADNTATLVAVLPDNVLGAQATRGFVPANNGIVVLELEDRRVDTVIEFVTNDRSDARRTRTIRGIDTDS